MDRLRCATCGLANFVTDATCQRCGRSLEGARREPAGWDAPSEPPQPRSNPPPGPPPPGEQPRFQDTARAGVWDPKATYADPRDPMPPPFGQPPQAYPPYQGAPPGAYEPNPQSPFRPPHPPVAGPFGSAGAHDQAALLIANAQKDARNALIAGLFGLVTFCCFGGLFLGIFAIVKGNEARRVLDFYRVEHGRSMALAATILGALDIVVSIVFLIANFGSALIR